MATNTNTTCTEVHFQEKSIQTTVTDDVPAVDNWVSQDNSPAVDNWVSQRDGPAVENWVSQQTGQEAGTDTNTTYTEVHFKGKSIQTTVTSDGSVVENWVNQQTGQEIVGFDLEWRPNFQKGWENDTALLQLCTDNGCLIIQMLFLNFKPEALVRFLKDPGVKLVGVGIEHDVEKLMCDHGLECRGQIELGALAAEKLERRQLKQAGLKGLAMEVLGLHLSKSKSISMSNWAWAILQYRQIQYACIDAFVSLAIGKKLLKSEN